MKKILLLLVALGFNLGLINAQIKVYPGKYAVKFVDKNNCGYSIDKPQDFLSQKALDRRNKYGIGIDNSDLPVSQQYVDELKNLGFKIHNVSKWLNCAVVVLDTTQNIDEQLAKLNDLSFVDLSWRKTLEVGPKGQNTSPVPNRYKVKAKKVNVGKPVLNYGNSDNQNTQIKVHALHNLGFTGDGMTAAILDAGFYRADVLEPLESIFKENRLLGVYDFVDNDYSVYDSDNHGMNVLSCIAANQSGIMIGTAPKASFYLFRTEDSATENVIEEFNWVFAAEKADSLGVDLIHSSLGYTDFDDDEMDYKHENLDGKTCVATIGANFAAQKGIVVTVSAGNEGDEPWALVSSPADSDLCISVGAVDKVGHIAYFSSNGPTYDGRVRPDACAKGLNSAVVNPRGKITTSSGTSFAGPILSGAVL